MKYTEHQIEAWLRPQTRTITDADGNAILLEQSTLFWTQFDRLINDYAFTEAELIGMGHEAFDEFGLPFALGIQDCVGHLHKAWRHRPNRTANQRRRSA